VAVTVTLLFALVLLSSIEMIQLFDDERGCTATDVVFNVSGTAVGVILGCPINSGSSASWPERRQASFFVPPAQSCSLTPSLLIKHFLSSHC
jgi:hypothetical protein